MKVSEKDAQILQHIVKHCDRILDTISYFGEDQTLFIDNHIYQGNVSINLQAIGEIVRHLSNEFLAKAKYIPWKQIKGQRNIIAHGYDTGVDFSKVWDYDNGGCSASEKVLRRYLERKQLRDHLCSIDS